MALGPELARLGPDAPTLTDAQRQTLDAIEQQVDWSLAQVFGSKPDSSGAGVQLPPALDAAPELEPYVIALYRAAGWRHVRIKHEPQDGGRLIHMLEVRPPRFGE